MNSVDRIYRICKERKIPISRLERDCGFSNGYIRGLRRGVLPNDRAQIIADYLGISSYYLNTGEDAESQEEAPVDMEVQIQNLITALTGDNSVYYCGESMTDESRLALLNSLKRDMEFLYALHSKKDDE